MQLQCISEWTHWLISSSDQRDPVWSKIHGWLVLPLLYRWQLAFRPRGVSCPHYPAEYEVWNRKTEREHATYTMQKPKEDQSSRRSRRPTVQNQQRRFPSPYLSGAHCFQPWLFYRQDVSFTFSLTSILRSGVDLFASFAVQQVVILCISWTQFIACSAHTCTIS